MLLKIPDFYEPLIYAGITAAMISALCDLRSGKQIMQLATGAVICGIVAVTVAVLLDYLALPSRSGAFIGVLIGFAGADTLKDISLGLIHRRTGAGCENKDSDKRP